MSSAKDFHNAFLDTSRPEKVMSYYVNRAIDDTQDSVAEMKQAVEWEETPGCYLFSGLRGAGKTTELQRLTTELADANIPAFYCNADAYLDLNDPTITQAELIFTALAGLADAVKAAYGKEFLQQTLWERVKSTMNSEVELQPTLKTAAPGFEAEVQFSLKENHTFKQELIKFAASSGSFFHEANQFANEVAAFVKQQTKQSKIVLIVDSLERLSAPNGQEHLLFESLKELFFNSPSRLFFDSISVIYTVPPYIHAVLPGIDQFYSGIFSLPNFKIMQTPKPSHAIERNDNGIAKMVEVVAKRFPDWQQYLTTAVIEEFAWLSGGNIRRMFALIRHTTRKAVLGKVVFPVAEITSEPVEQAIAEETKNIQWLNAQDRKWLLHCQEHSGQLAQCIKNLQEDLPPIIRLFDHSLVLNYQNGRVWYQVPPIIHGKI
ncbi:ATP-binding protein [Rheinheimera sp.]|uniref:ATP-binding protein n=1 Tax=Rheinheimera sp. TaxID=1869214 RepID=UPI00307F9E92